MNKKLADLIQQIAIYVNAELTISDSTIIFYWGENKPLTDSHSELQLPEGVVVESIMIALGFGGGLFLNNFGDFDVHYLCFKVSDRTE